MKSDPTYYLLPKDLILYHYVMLNDEFFEGYNEEALKKTLGERHGRLATQEDVTRWFHQSELTWTHKAIKYTKPRRIVLGNVVTQSPTTSTSELWEVHIDFGRGNLVQEPTLFENTLDSSGPTTHFHMCVYIQTLKNAVERGFDEEEIDSLIDHIRAS